MQPLINVQHGIWTIESERAASLINVQHGIFLFSYIVSVFSYFLGKTPIILATCAHNGQIHYFLAHNAHLKKNDLKNSQK